MKKNFSKIKKEYRIYLLRRIIQNAELSDEALATYVGLRYLITENKRCFFSDYILYRILFGKGCNPKEKMLLNLRKGMYQLFDYYQFGCEKVGPNTYMLDEADKQELYIDTVSQAFDEEEFFFHISYEHINKIMQVEGNVDKYKLLRLYLVMVSTINLKTLIGFTGRNKFMEWTGISSATITKYQDILVKLKVLHIIENGAVRDMKTGKIINMTNSYSLYENKEQCEQFAKDKRVEIRRDGGNADLDALERKLELYEDDDEIENKRQKGKRLFYGSVIESVERGLLEGDIEEMFGRDFDYGRNYDNIDEMEDVF